MNDREKAIKLIRDVTSHTLEVDEFCKIYERFYNFDWNNRFEEADIDIFEGLFRVVVFFTPYPEEKLNVYPGYKTSDEVIEAANFALSKLYT